MEISEAVKQKAIEWLNNNPFVHEWDYYQSLDRSQITKALKDQYSLYMEIEEMNLEFISDCEEDVLNALKEEVLELEGYDNSDLREEFLDYIVVDLNIKKLIDSVGEIPFLIYVYSNFDCTNSFDTIEDSEYMQQVYQRVKEGVKREDFVYEHINGAYGGSLFCFLMKGTISEIIEMKREVEKEKTLLIPKGTAFGFFSSFQGAGSIFEKATFQEFKLNTRETGKDFNPDYDNIGVVADAEQSYSMLEVYGQDIV